ncbi:MAG: DNA-directed RNA polymerase sigma-70 factor [Rhodothermaceae bacterium]|nr:MAG: DNA-directed RNA polymerase sigma-70 factor [Rhodothermaceae bacterium]
MTHETFEQHRPYLFGLAYRMLGSVADAEDVVQEAFLRWQRAGEVTIPRAFLTTVVTRLCIDQLRSARVQRETYVGPWLPEPLLASDHPPPDAGVERADTLSMAFLLLLERLTPVERAVFLLHDVFGYDFAEVAELVGKTAVNCRQIAHRARRRVRAGRPRFDTAPPDQARLADRFARAVQDGDLDGLLDLLGEDAVLYTDGGGKVAAALKPVHSASRIARFFLNLARKAGPDVRVHPIRVNGQPGFLVTRRGAVENVLTFHVEDGRIRQIYVVRNPEKLRHVPSDVVPEKA